MRLIRTLATILTPVCFIATSVQSYAGNPDAAFVNQVHGSELYIGPGNDNSNRRPAKRPDQLKGRDVLYVPGNGSWANLGFVVSGVVDHDGLMVQAGPHSSPSKWSFPCTGEGGFRIAWQRGGNRGCEQGVQLRQRSSNRSSLFPDPLNYTLQATKSLLKAQATDEEITVLPSSNEPKLIQTRDSGTGIEVETIQGDILVKSAKFPQGLRIPEGKKYSYPQNKIEDIDRDEIAKSPEMQDFLNPDNWLPPDLPQRVANGIGEQIGQHRNALGLPPQPIASRPGNSNNPSQSPTASNPSTASNPGASDILRVISGSGRITRSDYPAVAPVGTSVSQVTGAYNPATQKITLEIEGRQAEIALNSPLRDGTPIPFTVTQIIPRTADASGEIIGKQFTHLVQEALVKAGIQSQGTLIKQGNQIQGKFTAQSRWIFNRAGASATTGSVEGEFVLSLQPGTFSDTPTLRAYTPPEWFDVISSGQ